MPESVSEAQPSYTAFVEVVVSCECVDEAISLCLPLLKKASTHLRAAGALLERLRIRPGAVENDCEVKSVCRVLKRYAPPSATMAEMALSLLPLISPGQPRQEIVHLVTHFAVGDEEVAINALKEYIRLLQDDVSLLVPVIGSLQQLPLPPAACDSGPPGEKSGSGVRKRPYSGSTIPTLTETASAEELALLALRIVDEVDVPAVVRALLKGLGGERAKWGGGGGTISAIRHETCDVSLKCQAVLMTVLKQGLTMNAAAARALLRAVAADPGPLLPIDALAILILLPRPQHAALLERTLMPIASMTPSRLPWRVWEGVCTSPELDAFDEVIPAALDMGLWLLTVPLRRSSREDRVFLSRNEGIGNEEEHTSTHDLELFSNACKMLESIFAHYPSQRGRLVACLVSIACNDISASQMLVRGKEKTDDVHLQSCCTAAAELLLKLVRKYPAHFTCFSGVVGDAVMSVTAVGRGDNEHHGTESLSSSTLPITLHRAQELLAATAANLASYTPGLSANLQIHLQKMLLSNSMGSVKGADSQLLAISLAENILQVFPCNTSEFSDVLSIVSRFVEFGLSFRSQNIEAPIRALRLVMMFAEKYNMDERKTGELLLGSGKNISNFMSELVQKQGVLKVVRLTQGRCEEGLMMMHPVPSSTVTKDSGGVKGSGGGIESNFSISGSMSKGKAETLLAINVIGKAKQIVEGHLLGAPQLVCRLVYATWLSKLESASPDEVDRHLRAPLLLPSPSLDVMTNDQLSPTFPWHLTAPLPVEDGGRAAVADTSVLLLEGVSWGIAAAVLAASAEFCTLKYPELSQRLGWAFLEATKRLRCAASEIESHYDPSEEEDQGGLLLLTEFCRVIGRLLPMHALWCCCGEVKDGKVGGDSSVDSIQAGCEAFEMFSLSLLTRGANDEDWLLSHKCTTGSIYVAACDSGRPSVTKQHIVYGAKNTSISNTTESLMRLEAWLTSANCITCALSKARTSKRKVRPKPGREGSVPSSDEMNDIHPDLLHRFLLAHLASIVVILRHMECLAEIVKEPSHEKLCSIILQHLRVSESPTCASLLLDALAELSISTVDTTLTRVGVVVSEAWKILTTVYPLTDNVGISKGGRRVNAVGILQFPQVSTLGFEQTVLDLLRNSRVIHYAARGIGTTRDSSLLCPTTLRKSAEISRWVCFSICWSSCHAMGRVEVLASILSAFCDVLEGGSGVGRRIDLNVLLSLLLQFLRLLPLTVSLGGPLNNKACSKSSPFEGLEKAVELVKWTLEAVEVWITIPSGTSRRWQPLQKLLPSKRIKPDSLKPSNNNKDLDHMSGIEYEEDDASADALVALDAMQKRSHTVLRSCIRALKVARDKLTDCNNWRNTVPVEDVR